jgi:hypothetical protein
MVWFGGLYDAWWTPNSWLILADVLVLAMKTRRKRCL